MLSQAPAAELQGTLAFCVCYPAQMHSYFFHFHFDPPFSSQANKTDMVHHTPVQSTIFLMNVEKPQQ